MPRLLIDGDVLSIEALRVLLSHHPTLTVRPLTDTENEIVTTVLPQPNLFVPPLELPAWCVIPDRPHAVQAEPGRLRPERLHLSTDGSSKGNPGEVGMAVVVYDVADRSKGTVGHGWGHPGPHTNNQAELTAVLSALNFALTRRASHAEIVTDSEYVYKGLPKFEGRHKAGTLGEVKNLSLWLPLIAAKAAYEAIGGELNLLWIKGHAGDANNERADKLAVQARKGLRYLRQEFSETPTEPLE